MHAKISFLFNFRVKAIQNILRSDSKEEGSIVPELETLHESLKDDFVFVETQEDDLPILLKSAREGKTKVVEDLLNDGTDVDTRSNKEQTALYFASEQGHFETVKLLCERGAGVDLSDIFNITPVIISAKNGNSDCVEILLNHGANINWQDGSKQTALLHAVSNGDTDTVHLLCTRGAHVDVPNYKQATALITAAWYGHAECIEILLKHNADINWKDTHRDTALHWAAWKGHADIVEYLCTHNAEVDVSNEIGASALLAAAENGHTKCVETLINHRANVNWQNNSKQTALFRASYKGHIHTVEYLCAQAANVDIADESTEATALLASSHEGHTQCVQILLNYNANINWTNKYRQTALYWALRKSHLGTVRVILKHSPDPTIKSKKGISALDLIEDNPAFTDIIHLSTSDEKAYIAAIQSSWKKVDVPSLVFPFTSKEEMYSAYYKIILGCAQIAYKCIEKSTRFASFLISKENDTQLIIYPREYGETGCLLMEVYTAATNIDRARDRLARCYNKMAKSELMHVNEKCTTKPHVCPCLNDENDIFVQECLIKCSDLELDNGQFALAMCQKHHKIIPGDRIAAWFRHEADQR